MADTETKISCDGCGRQYKWKPEIAGRKVRCKCGSILTVPQAQPEPPQEDDLYSFADEIVSSVQSGGGAVAPIAPIAMASSAAAVPPIKPIAPVVTPARSAVPSPMLGYQTRPTQRQVEQGSALGIEGSMGKDLILPIAMILGGTVLNFITLCVIGSAPFGEAALWIGVSSILSTLLIAVGCFAAIKLLDFSLGAPLQALLKVAAVAIAPDAVGDLITAVVPFGGMLAIFLTLGIYFALLMAFFDLDGTEVMITTCIFWVIQTWVVMIIVMGILSSSSIGDSIRNSGGGNALIAASGGGLAAIETSADSEPTEADLRAWADQGAITYLRDGEKAEQWLEANPDATFHTIGREASIQFTNDLLAAGSPQVAACGMLHQWDKKQPKEARILVITWPTEPAQKARAEALVASFANVYQSTIEREDGNQFVILEFLRNAADRKSGAGEDDEDWDDE